jgi:hypothetical protein
MTEQCRECLLRLAKCEQERKTNSVALREHCAAHIPHVLVDLILDYCVDVFGPHGPLCCRLRGKFDPQRVSAENNYFIVGARQRGKTTLLFDLSSQMKNQYNKSLQISHGDDLQKWLTDRRQNNCNNSPVLLALEESDVFDLQKCVSFLELVRNNRTYRITTIATVTFPPQVTPLAEAIDYAFCFRESLASARKRLFLLLTRFETFKQFEEVFDIVTRDYGCLVCALRASNCPYCSSYWYTADKEEQHEFVSVSDFDSGHHSS